MADTTGHKKYFRIKLLSLGEVGVGKSCLIKRYCEQKFLPRYIPTIGVDFGVRSVHVDLGIPRGAHEVKVNFWDLSGDDDFSEVRNEFMGDTQAALLVFDVMNRASFIKLDNWWELLINGNCNRTTDLLSMTSASRLYSDTNPRPEGISSHDDDLGLASSSTYDLSTFETKLPSTATAAAYRDQSFLAPPVIAVVANKSDESGEDRRVTRDEAKSWADAHGFMYFETSAKTGENVNELFAAVLEKTLGTLLSRESRLLRGSHPQTPSISSSDTQTNTTNKFRRI